MRRAYAIILIFICFSSLFLLCYAPALFLGRQFGYRDAGHYYYPLNERVQKEWNEGRWPPLWEPEENAGMPLLGNPTAAVLYPGKLVFAFLPYEWGARVYIVMHSALAFFAMLVLMRSWAVSWFGSALSALAYAFGAPILFQYCNIIYLIGAAWLPLGFHGVDQWIRLGRRWGLLELAFVLAMQVLGGDPQMAYLIGLMSIGYALIAVRSRHRGLGDDDTLETPPRRSRIWRYVPIVIVAATGYFVLTVALAQWLPRMRDEPPEADASALVDALGPDGGHGGLVYRGGFVSHPLVAPWLAVSAGAHDGRSGLFERIDRRGDGRAVVSGA